MSSTLQLLTDALQDIGAAGLNESEIHAEDIAKALRKFNQIVGIWSTRERFKRFERMQSFAFVTSKQSYSIGPAHRDAMGVLDPSGDPDFIVATGKRPVKITRANWIFGETEPRQYEPLAIVAVEQYADIRYPSRTNVNPYGIYYQATFPQGTIWPWPYPTVITDELQLFWWDQLEEVLLADITTELALPPGYELALSLTLAEALCLPFGKERSEQLKEDASKARADIQSLNTQPPKLDTSGRMVPPGGWYGWCP